MKYNKLFVLLLMLLALPAAGQEREPLVLQVTARLETECLSTKDGNEFSLGNSILYSKFYGGITDNLTFKIQNRWIRYGFQSWYTNFFRCEDLSIFDIAWLNLRLGNFDLNIGKNSLGIGDYEYDLYSPDESWEVLSSFWHCVQPYLWGAKVAYHFADGSEAGLQLSDSPYNVTLFAKGYTCFSAYWMGEYDSWRPYYSFNTMQYDDNKYIKFLALGNTYTAGPWYFELNTDFRFKSWSNPFNDELTLSTRIRYNFSESWDLQFKGIWEFSHENPSLMGYGTTWNCAHMTIPATIYPGQDLLLGSLTLHYFPLKDKSLRLHAVISANTCAKGGSLGVGATYNFIRRW